MCDCGRDCPEYDYPSGRNGYDPLRGQCENDFLAELRAQGAQKKPPPGLPSRGKKRFPRVLADEVITSWNTQAELAEIYRFSTRQLQRLEPKGLPAFGTGADKRYPLPQAAVWLLEYRHLRNRGTRVDYLPLDVALARHELGTVAMLYAEQTEPRDLVWIR